MGTVDGRKVFVFAHDFRILEGSLGEVFASKIHQLLDLAEATGAPWWGSTTGRSPHPRGHHGTGRVRRHLRPQRRAVRGGPPALRGPGPVRRWSGTLPRAHRLRFTVRDRTNLFITGPDVVEAVTGPMVLAGPLDIDAANILNSKDAHRLASYTRNGNSL